MSNLMNSRQNARSNIIRKISHSLFIVHLSILITYQQYSYRLHFQPRNTLNTRKDFSRVKRVDRVESLWTLLDLIHQSYTAGLLQEWQTTLPFKTSSFAILLPYVSAQIPRPSLAFYLSYSNWPGNVPYPCKDNTCTNS